MKRKFSNSWTGSRQPRKQRKYLANAPLHIRHKLVSANLSKELRKKYGKRNFPLRKNDEVRIMRGEFKGKAGKVEKIDLKNVRIAIAGIFRSKKDGTKISVYFHPSNVQIKELSMEDKKRIKSIERKNIKKLEEKTEHKEIKKENKTEDKTKQTKETKNVPKKK
jgi:large subunit ribosomal protein L24